MTGTGLLPGGYGPNAPYDGNAYGEDGELIYSGRFEIKRGGVGWPMIQKPIGFPLERKTVRILTTRHLQDASGQWRPTALLKKQSQIMKPNTPDCKGIEAQRGALRAAYFFSGHL